MKNNISYIHSLADGSVTNLIHHGRFFRWTDNPREFFATRGNFECPALDNLEDQELIAFDVMRFSLDNLDTPLVLGNIAGGLRFPQAISNDGRWGSFLNCACYSECGGYSVWEIASGTTREHGLETLFTGAVDFSPNSAQLTVASQQMYGFIESPLYLANADFSGLHEIYFTPGEAPMDPRWSPDGGWIAFTVYVIDSTTYEASNSSVLLIRPDGSGLTTVEGGYAVFLDWSPDGSQLLYSMPAEGGTALYLYDLATAEKTLLPISTSPQLDWGVLP
jgi:WD40 repeat protein